VAVVYASATLSLATLEYFVHLDPSDMPGDLVAVPADVPDGLPRTEIRAESLPPNWRAYPAPDALAELGTAWARARKTPILLVPSVIVPQERNVLLNPAHPEFRRIRVGPPEPFSFDPRLWRR
jgi:RES domain-containing protein